MDIRLPDFDYKDYGSSVDMIAQFIKVQQNLEHFTLRESHFSNEIGDALMHQKSSILHIEFIQTVFDITCLLNWLPFCENLESLTFDDSELIPLKLIPINRSPFKRLKSLTFKDYCIPVVALEAIIHSSNTNLQEIIFGFRYRLKKR